MNDGAWAFESMMLSPSRSQAQLVTPPGSLVKVVSVKVTLSGVGPEVVFAVKFANRPWPSV